MENQYFPSERPTIGIKRVTSVEATITIDLVKEILIKHGYLPEAAGASPLVPVIDPKPSHPMDGPCFRGPSDFTVDTFQIKYHEDE